MWNFHLNCMKNLLVKFQSSLNKICLLWVDWSPEKVSLKSQVPKIGIQNYRSFLIFMHHWFFRSMISMLVSRPASQKTHPLPDCTAKLFLNQPQQHTTNTQHLLYTLFFSQSSGSDKVQYGPPGLTDNRPIWWVIRYDRPVDFAGGRYALDSGARQVFRDFCRLESLFPTHGNEIKAVGRS